MSEKKGASTFKGIDHRQESFYGGFGHVDTAPLLLALNRIAKAIEGVQLSVTMPELSPRLEVASPDVIVNIPQAPEQVAPVVNIHIPEQPAPVVNMVTSSGDPVAAPAFSPNIYVRIPVWPIAVLVAVITLQMIFTYFYLGK